MAFPNFLPSVAFQNRCKMFGMHDIYLFKILIAGDGNVNAMQMLHSYNVETPVLLARLNCDH